MSAKGIKNFCNKFIVRKLVYVPVDTVHEVCYPIAIEQMDDVGLTSTIRPLPVGRWHDTHHATSANQRRPIRSLLQKHERKQRSG